MIKAQYRSDGWRPDLSQYKKIIDIGGANSFAHGQLDTIVDIRYPQADARHKIIGNIDFPDVWDDVYVNQYESEVLPFDFDYCICTHTLEDINNPLFACQEIEKIAKRGLIIVPSKFKELGRFNHGGFNARGFVHHRWIWDILDGKLTAWPKQSFIEHMDLDLPAEDFQEELVIEWEGSIDMQYINDGMPYGTDTMSGEEHMKYLFNLLKNKNL